MPVWLKNVVGSSLTPEALRVRRQSISEQNGRLKAVGQWVRQQIGRRLKAQYTDDQAGCFLERKAEQNLHHKAELNFCMAGDRRTPIAASVGARHFMFLSGQINIDPRASRHRCRTSGLSCGSGRHHTCSSRTLNAMESQREPLQMTISAAYITVPKTK